MSALQSLGLENRRKFSSRKDNSDDEEDHEFRKLSFERENYSSININKTQQDKENVDD
jgi:hypothetical protein